MESLGLGQTCLHISRANLPSLAPSRIIEAAEPSSDQNTKALAPADLGRENSATAIDIQFCHDTKICLKECGLKAR